MSEGGRPFWWKSLGNRIGKGELVDQLEKDFDPGFRSKLGNVEETIALAQSGRSK